MIAPPDIENSAMQSGYDHVGYNVAAQQSITKTTKPYQAVAYGGSRDKAGTAWMGRRRLTALEAAQDYCDYVNNGGAVTLAFRTSGHSKVTTDRPQRAGMPAEVAAAKDKVSAWEREQREAEDAQNYVYLIGEKGCHIFVKIGESLEPLNRPAGLQTGNPRTLLTLAFRKTPIKVKADIPLHVKHAKDHHKDEWFYATADVLAEFGLTPNKFKALVK